MKTGFLIWMGSRYALFASGSSTMWMLRTILAHPSPLVQIVCLIGLIRHGYVRLCYSFALYLLIAAVTNGLIVVDPNRFFHLDFWLMKETALAILKFSIALELAFRTFHAFPGALVTLRRVILVVVVIVLFGLVALPTQPSSIGIVTYRQIVTETLPRIQNGTIWLFTAVAALILWYRLPIHFFQKNILIGFVPYLLAFTLTLNMLGSQSSAGAYLNRFSSIAYIAVCAYWAYAAWRPARAVVRPRTAHTAEQSA